MRLDAPLVPRQASELRVILLRAQGAGGSASSSATPASRRWSTTSTAAFAPGFFEPNALGEIRFGELGVFVNAI